MASLAAADIQPLAELLSGLEERNELLSDCNRIAGARIAADTRLSLFDRESTEAPQLDPIAARKGFRYLIKDSAYDTLYIPMIEMWVLFRNALN